MFCMRSRQPPVRLMMCAGQVRMHAEHAEKRDGKAKHGNEQGPTHTRA